MYNMANMENFSNIVGHEFAKKFILSSIQKNRIAHAYLFSGPEAVGKFKFAVEIAKIIQCGVDCAGSADGKISARAEKIESGADPDVLLFDNSFSENIEDNDNNDNNDSFRQKSISVGDIRKIEYHLNLSPYDSKYKVAIVRNAHLFTTEAANAFLKTMEEPRGDSIIILVADNINYLPKTLISRSQMIRFGTVRKKTIKDFLIKKGASEEGAERISRVSGGRAGVAIDLWKHPEKLQNYFDKEKEWQKFISGTLDERFGIIEKITADEGINAGILDLWLEYSRDCLVEKYLSGEYQLNGSFGRNSACPAPAAMIKFITSLNAISKLIKNSNVSKKLALENLALEI